MNPYRNFILLLIPLFCISSFISNSYAGKVRTLPLSNITKSAQYIFEGTCTAVKTGKDERSGMLATWYTFEIINGIKGKYKKTFTFKQLGGSNQTQSLTVPMTNYEEGEHVILFLYPESKIGFTSSVGMHQGKFSILKEKNSGKPYVTNGMPGITLFAGLPQSANGVAPQGITASGAQHFLSNRFEKEEFLGILEELINQQKLEKN